MLLSDHSVIPSVMFHSVGLTDDKFWPMVNISEPLDLFRRKIDLLHRRGYEFLHWEDVYSYMQNGPARSSPGIMLTFDDGYLDNWTYVFPILKEFGVRATIFVNPDFVDPGTEVRPNMDDVSAGRVAEEDLEIPGFLNWPEMRVMESSGLIDIQSHTMTHTWYFKGPKVIDFHSPQERRYPWMAWNLDPAKKPYSMSTDLNSVVTLGSPIYEHEKSLICRRYFPPARVLSEITGFVEKNGGESFYNNDHWKKTLFDLHSRLMIEHETRGRYETDEEYQGRVRFELAEAKELIGSELKKQVEYVCWPGGGYNDSVISIAKQLGIKAWTLASNDQGSFRNTFGATPCQIKRVSSSVKYISPGGEDCGYAGEYYFLSNIERHKGSLIGKWFARLLRIVGVIRARIA